MREISNELSIPNISTKGVANAFVLGIIFNQAQRANLAWSAPSKLRKRLGTLDPAKVVAMPRSAIRAAFRDPPAIHRLTNVMAKYFEGAWAHLAQKYRGDARNIWSDSPTARELLDRLTEFPGIGPHKAEVAIFLLTVEFGIPVVKDKMRIRIDHSCPALYERYAPIAEPYYS